MFRRNLAFIFLLKTLWNLWSFWYFCYRYLTSTTCTFLTYWFLLLRSYHYLIIFKFRNWLERFLPSYWQRTVLSFLYYIALWWINWLTFINLNLWLSLVKGFLVNTRHSSWCLLGRESNISSCRWSNRRSRTLSPSLHLTPIPVFLLHICFYFYEYYFQYKQKRLNKWN